MSALAPAAAVPSIRDYEAWLETLDGRARSRTALTAAQWRRMAIMRRSGETFAAVAQATGRTHAGVRRAWDHLPEALR